MADAASADLASLAADLSAASGDSIAATAAQLIRQAAMQVKDEAQSRAPVKSGRLKESISVRFTGPMSAVVGPHVDYAAYQEFGTGTRGEFPGPMYTIKPKSPRGVLAFTVGGKRVFARVVHHPGIPAHPFMRPAFEAVLGPELLAKLADAGAAAITKGPNA